MADTVSWTLVAATFVVLPLVTRPAISRAFGRLAERAGEWAKAREAKQSALDPEQEKLWQWTKRRRLCAALDRIERLIATDSWMSATRQLGNRLPSKQLWAGRRRPRAFFPAGLDLTAGPTWAPARTTRRWTEPRGDVWDD